MANAPHSSHSKETRRTREQQHALLKCGSGPFVQSLFAPGLVLVPDSPTHGVIRPAQLVQLTEFEANLAATRTGWQIDES